jgi:hypothetical protein
LRLSRRMILDNTRILISKRRDLSSDQTIKLRLCLKNSSDWDHRLYVHGDNSRPPSQLVLQSLSSIYLTKLMKVMHDFVWPLIDVCTAFEIT